jgi:hypothetical protein
MSFIIGLAGTAGSNEPFAQFPGPYKGPAARQILTFLLFFFNLKVDTQNTNLTLQASLSCMPGCISWGDQGSLSSIPHPRAAAKKFCAVAAPLVGYNPDYWPRVGRLMLTTP